MSDAQAIAALTATLRNLLNEVIDDIPGTSVTTRSPDRARLNITGNSLNLFMFQASPNAAWRNQDIPSQTRNGESGRPALALTLSYLVTAYGDNDDEVTAHRLLGRAMSILHDHAVLQPDEIELALPGNDLHLQVERVRITLRNLSLEDISKLWAAFQVEYRVSTAYEASVVLIESTLPRRSPLPVLRRGSQDQGVTTVAAPGPTITRVAPDVGRPGLFMSARLGDDLVLEGENLDATGTLRFTSTRLATPVALSPVAHGSGLRAHLPTPAEDADAQHRWVPGIWTVALIVTRPGLPTVASNEAPVPLAPIITLAPSNAPAGDVALQVTCSPRVRDEQTVLLLFAERQVAPTAVTNPADITLPSTIDFTVPAVSAGVYVVRLRVDGVDSIPLTMPLPVPPQPLEFDPLQQMTVA